MGKNLNGKELGKGLSQRKDGTFMGRYVDRFGSRQCVYSKNLADVRQKLAIAEAKVVEKRDIIKIKSLFVSVAIPTEDIGITKPEMIIVFEKKPAI